MQDNLYVNSTSPNMKKKLHHRLVPMMMFTADDKEVVLPVVLGTSRDMIEAEANAELDVQAQLKTEVALSNRGVGSTWLKLMNYHRSAWIIYFCTRMPNDLTKKFFESKDHVIDTYDPDQLGILMDHYGTVRYTSPHFKLIDPEDPNAFQEAIQKIKELGTESDFFLNGLTTHSLIQLLKYSVSHPGNSENTTGLSGSPSNSGSTRDSTRTPKPNAKTK